MEGQPEHDQNDGDEGDESQLRTVSSAKHRHKTAFCLALETHTTLVWDGFGVQLRISSSRRRDSSGQDKLLWVIIDNPLKENVNTISETFGDAMEQAMEQAMIILLEQSKPDQDGNHQAEQEQDQICAIVLASAKPDSFIVGADLGSIGSFNSQSDALHGCRRMQRFLKRLRNLKCPTIALINGACLGGGAELCLACSYRTCFDTPSLSIGFPEAQLGLLPAAGGSVYFPRLVGLLKAIEIIVSGMLLTKATEARQCGFVDLVLPPDWQIRGDVQAIETALIRLCKTQKPRSMTQPKFLDSIPIFQSFVSIITERAIRSKTKGAYPAPFWALYVIIRALRMSESDGLDLEALVFATLTQTQASRNLVSLFLLREKMKHQARRFQSVDQPIGAQTIAVAGAGSVGSAIAQLLLIKLVGSEQPFRHGDMLLLYDPDQQVLSSGQQKIHRLICEFFMKKRRCDRNEAARAADKLLRESGRFRITSSIEDLCSVDVVIESLPVDSETAAAHLLQEFRQHKINQNKRGIFLSNSPVISIPRVVEENDPVKVGMLRFGIPVHAVPVVEAVSTNPEALSMATHLAGIVGKTPVVLCDFVSSRLFAAMCSELLYMIDDHTANLCQITRVFDKWLLGNPLQMLDDFGIGVLDNMLRKLRQGPSGPEVWPESQFLSWLCQHGCTGKDAGKGIYEYTSSGKPTRISSSVLAAASHSSTFSAPTNQNLIHRVALRVINEAGRLIEENITSDGADDVSVCDAIDFISVCCVRFPPGLGGILRFADAEWPNASDLLSEMRHFATLLSAPRFEPCSYITQQSSRNDGLTLFHRRPHQKTETVPIPRISHGTAIAQLAIGGVVLSTVILWLVHMVRKR